MGEQPLESLWKRIQIIRWFKEKSAKNYKKKKQRMCHETALSSMNLRFKRWSDWLRQLTCAHMRYWCYALILLNLGSL